MVLYGLTIQVFDLTQSTHLDRMLLLTFLVPAVVFGAIAGVFVDRYDRRKILIWTNVARGLLFLALVFFDTNLLAHLHHHRHRGHADHVLRARRDGDDPAGRQAQRPDDRERPVRAGPPGVLRPRLRGAGAAGPGRDRRQRAHRHRGRHCTCVAGVLCWTLPRGAARCCATSRATPCARSASPSGRRCPSSRTAWSTSRTTHNIFWALAYLTITSSLIGVLGVLGPAFAVEALGLTTVRLLGARAATGHRPRARHPHPQRVRQVRGPQAAHRDRPRLAGHLAAHPRRAQGSRACRATACCRCAT